MDATVGWGGVECVTVGVADYSNNRQGGEWNYRGPRSEGAQPAHPVGSWRGDKARQADRLSEGMLRVFLLGDGDWAMENPVGALVDQPWMQPVRQFAHRVDFCAYWTREEQLVAGPTKKSRVWTMVGWQPKGATGDGKCGMRRGGCRHNGGFQDAQDEEVRNRVPELLVEEWLEAVRAGRQW